jgi:hypothetical protein
MEANKNFAKWLSCGIQISGTFGLHHVCELLMAECIKIMVFWHVTPYSLVDSYQHVKGISASILGYKNPENGVSGFL